MNGIHDKCSSVDLKKRLMLHIEIAKNVKLSVRKILYNTQSIVKFSKF